MVTLQLRQLSVPPGHRVIFHDVSWQKFEAILEELGAILLIETLLLTPAIETCVILDKL
jgi:hypothetical protein